MTKLQPEHRLADMTDLPALPPAELSPMTETAQRFLASAYDSVEEMLSWYHSIMELAQEDAAAGHSWAARTQEGAEDMLRAMLVFAGAGLDSAVKQLLRDALPALTESNEQAGERFRAFVQRQVATSSPTAARSLAMYLTAREPREAIIAHYVEELTGSSLQSVERIDDAVAGLGVSDSALRRRLKELRPLFNARNQIVHELDLIEVARHGDRQRRVRPAAEVVSLAHAGLSIGQEIINAVAKCRPIEHSEACS